MVIVEINKNQVIELMGRTLCVPQSDSNDLDDIILAASVRRIAGFVCPCSEMSLIKELINSLKHLSEDEEILKHKIEDIIEKLIIGGDLLELSDVSTNEINAKGTWIFAASPAFMARPNGNIFIFGITPDENSPLSSLSERIQYEGCKRYISPNSEEDIGTTLKELGLIEFSEESWLRLPKNVLPQEYLLKIDEKLTNSNYSGSIPDLTILDSDRPVNYYRGRWVVPKDHTGRFVARRPQVYGAPIWCYVELENGNAKKLLDFPLHSGGLKQRGCDWAWRLQMAIDHHKNFSQHYRVRKQDNGAIIDFFSPLPLWAERRFIALGQAVPPQKNLFSYLIPSDEFLYAEKFIKEYLWLQQID